MGNAQTFYDQAYRAEEYASFANPQAHSHYAAVQQFVERFGLKSKRCLEIGCGRGAFQALVDDYVGVDYSQSAARFMQRPFVCASATALPFRDNSFDAIWSITVLEHVPDPEAALREMRRVLKPDGLLLLAPAWQCRPWAADGYPVRPYSDFGVLGKLIKASIPIRDSVAFRAAYVFPRRAMRLGARLLRGGPTKFRFRRIRANYEKFWMSDSDACASMDPYEAILWFQSRGDVCIEPATSLRQFFFRTGPLTIRIRK